MTGEVRGENLTAQTDGEATTFTVANAYVTGSLRVYWEGVRLTDEVTESSSTTFTLSVTIPSGDRLYVDYYKS